MNEPDYDLLAPSSILVDRESRQRSEISDNTDLELSISQFGQLQPCVITRNLYLIAGERRLRACQNLGIQVKVHYYEQLPLLVQKKIEFDENCKRKDYSWQDFVRAIGQIHEMSKEEHQGIWSNRQTARSLGIDNSYIRKVLLVYKHLDDPQIKLCTGTIQAYVILDRRLERQAAEVTNKLLSEAQDIFESKEIEDVRYSIPNNSPEPSNDPINRSVSFPSSSDMPFSADITTQETSQSSSRTESYTPDISRTSKPDIYQTNFLDWAKDYSGDKFNLIHCDFPYGTLLPGDKRAAEYEAGKDVFDNLLETFCTNFNNFASFSCHVMFWFSMNYYQEVKAKLEGIGLWIDPFPLIWSNTNGYRLVPVPGKTPGHVYHTCFLGMRGTRPLIKVINNSYSAPGPKANSSETIHTTQKPQPMLEYFLSMLVDNTSSVLDPTCGSATALLASERLGARQILGLELDADMARASQINLDKQRLLNKLANEEEN